MSIEEIKKRWAKYYIPGSETRNAQVDIETLLTLLETSQIELKQADQLREIRDGQLEACKEQIELDKLALEKERARHSSIHWYQEWYKENERADRAEKKFSSIHWYQQYEKLRRAIEKHKEHYGEASGLDEELYKALEEK